MLGGSTIGGWFETSLRCTVLVSAITADVDAGSKSDPCRPWDRWVSGIG
jgi:hypothetical protein